MRTVTLAAENSTLVLGRAEIYLPGSEYLGYFFEPDIEYISYRFGVAFWFNPLNQIRIFPLLPAHFPIPLEIVVAYKLGGDKPLFGVMYFEAI